MMEDSQPSGSGSSSKTQCIGRFCEEIGMNPEHFVGSTVALPSVNVIQNGVVLELFEYLSGNLNFPIREIAKVILKLVGREDVNVNSTVSRIWRFLNSHKKAKKNKRTQQDAINSLLSKNFQISRRQEELLDTPRKKKLKKELLDSNKQLKTAKRKLQETSDLVITMAEKMEKEISHRQSTESTNKQLSEEVEHLSKSLDALTEEKQQILQELDELTKNFNPVKHELEEYTKKYEKARTELSSIQVRYNDTIKKMSNTSTRNINKKLKRRDDKIEELKDAKLQAKKMEQTVKELQEELGECRANLNATECAANEMEEQIVKSRKEKKRVYQSYWYEKKKGENENNTFGSCERELAYLQTRINTLTNKNKELADLVDLLKDEEITTFKDGRYSDDIRITIMELLACNVSMAKVSKVMKVVVKNLAGKDLRQVPSLATVSQIALEARHIADVEVATAMSTNNLTGTLGNCLHGDGTTKYHKKYQGFQVTLPDGSSRTMCLTQMAKGNTEGTMEAFKGRLRELAESISIGENSDAIYNELICSFKSTMTDQGPGMPQMSERVKMLREELLPSVLENWETLPQDGKSTLLEFGTFFCKMHPLINFAEEIGKVLKSLEEISTCGKNPHTFSTSEAGVTRLIRTASKAFNHRGCDKSGVEDAFTTYLDREFEEKNHIVDFIGNRANILFEGAATTYYHHDHIVNFVSILPDPNNLLLAVKEDISEPIHLAELRALGIIYHTITEPLWRKIKSVDNILSVNVHLHDLQKKLQEWKEDATPLLAGAAVSSNIPIYHNHVSEKLFQKMNPDAEAMCIQALEMACCGMLLILERQCADQLPGGKYWNIANSDTYTNVPATNVIAERDFAQLDLLLRAKPAARTLTLETLIMWVNNKTPEWLKTLDSTARSKYMSQARAHSKEILSKYQDRMKEIKSQRWAQLQEKQKKKREKEDKERKQTVALVTDVMSLGGVWTTEEEASRKYHELKLEGEHTARRAIYTQLQFMQKNLKCLAPSKEHFQLSSNQVQFTSMQKFDHLKDVINANDMTVQPAETTPSQGLTYTDPETREQRFREQKLKQSKKIEYERQKRAAESSKRHLQALLEDPTLLLGKRIDHLFNVEKEKHWYSGTVVSIKKEEENKLKTLYAIDYDLETEIEHYRLLQDLSKTELILHM